MKASLYKGSEKNGRIYYVHLNDGIDGTKMIGDDGKPLAFVKKETLKGEIVTWKPFRAFIRGNKQMKFSCPHCGSENCERPNKNFSDPNFWQGHFICSECGKGEFCYYSDCFVESVRDEEQLSLF